jgi:hypothetical protein
VCIYIYILEYSYTHTPEIGSNHTNVQAVVMQRLGELHQGHMAHEQEAGEKIAEAHAKYTNAEDEDKGDDDTAMAS